MRLITKRQIEFARRVGAGEDPIKVAGEVYADLHMSALKLKEWTERTIQKPQVRRKVIKVYEQLETIGAGVDVAAIEVLRVLKRNGGKDRDKLRAAEIVFEQAKLQNEVEGSKSDPLFIIIQQQINRGLAVPENVMEAVAGLAEQPKPGLEAPDEPAFQAPEEEAGNSDGGEAEGSLPDLQDPADTAASPD